jgi:hypothetical protein
MALYYLSSSRKTLFGHATLGAWSSAHWITIYAQFAHWKTSTYVVEKNTLSTPNCKSFEFILAFLLYILAIPRYVVKAMYLKKAKQVIIWNVGSITRKQYNVVM